MKRWNVKKKKKKERWNVFLHPLNQALWCSLACIACGRNDGETVLSLNFVSPCTFPHFLLESCLYQVNKSRLRWVAQSCPTLCDPIDCSPPGTSVHGDSPGKNTRVSCHALFQGIFPTQGLIPAFPHCTWILYHLSHQGSPRIAEWVAYSFSRGSSWPRNWTSVSCTAGGFFTS